MFFRRLKSEGLAAYSYLIGEGGVAAVIDPRRDCEGYVRLAEREGARVRFVFETHRNEDFVTGSTELAALTNAEVFHGRQLDFHFGNPLGDGQEFRLGSLLLRALHTPGHTEESFSLVAHDLDTGREPALVFTGDALFVGSVGRLDLFGGGGHELEAAGFLYDSVFGRLLELGTRPSSTPATAAARCAAWGWPSAASAPWGWSASRAQPCG